MPTTPLPIASAPRNKPAAGACDCHCHVFGPFDAYPLAHARSYDPPQAPPQAFLAMLDQLGMDRGVLVQPSAHGLDNRAMLAALAQAPARLRGVAVVDADTTQAQLQTLWTAGVRGLRFSRLRDAQGRARYQNTVDVDALPAILPSLRALGMHVQLWINLDQLQDLAPLMRRAGVPFVLDHMGHLDPAAGTRTKAFQQLCGLIADGLLYVKLTPYRPSRMAPHYQDMRPFHEQLVSIRPDRLLWGSDWPHIHMAENVPDAGRLLDLLHDWTADAVLLDRILVRNPQALYGFPPI